MFKYMLTFSGCLLSNSGDCGSSDGSFAAPLSSLVSCCVGSPGGASTGVFKKKKALNLKLI